MTPTFDSAAFDRVTDPVLRLFPTQSVRDLADYRPEPSLEAEIEELARKSNEGELSAPERAKYVGYVQANKFVAILQARARRLLDQGNG
jgi:hypothetical protein